MRLVQIIEQNKHVAALVDGDRLRLMKLGQSVYELAGMAEDANASLEAVVEDQLGHSVSYEEIVLAGLLAPPYTHPDPYRMLVAGTGLSHTGSAQTRSNMHAGTKESELTDSMKMFNAGMEGGKPQEGQFGAQPEWFYKGDGSILVAPGKAFLSPSFGEDFSEEPEIAALYRIGKDGAPLRIGFALGNEASDHVTEKQNYLLLAHSKLRQCAIGPELLIGNLPSDIKGSSRIIRDGSVLWEKSFLTGEDNMCHSLYNLESHHFKYGLFCRPGMAHIHFLGTATLSFGDNIKTQPGDIFEISAPEFGRALKNSLKINQVEIPNVVKLSGKEGRLMLSGKNLIAGQWVVSETTETSQDLDGFKFYQATEAQVDQAAKSARTAFRDYANRSRAERAAFLRLIASEIDARGDMITEIGMKETGLPEARLNGERGRTTGQLKMFADLIENDNYLDIRVDEALPNREPLPRPDLRLTHRPIGPVVVFGASNFPLAFSTAGGDTASALAAGCPVIVKGHNAHAGTAEIVAQAILSAIEKSGMPSGVFQMLQGAGRVVGSALVTHEEIRAVGFTGSLAGGRALFNLCTQRPHPIPFYGELGSVNPVFLLPNALSTRSEAIGAGWAASLTMGAGQFCTNPGVVIGLKGNDLAKFEESAVAALKQVAEQKMLTDGIHKAYEDGVKNFRELMVEVGSCGASNGQRTALPAVFKVDAQKWISTPALQEEVFGAAGIIVECDTIQDMINIAENIEGQLTATLHLEQSDVEFASKLSTILEEKAGRLLCNGFPTGVEVCSAMMHGGPYPASTDVRATSVGTLAINRFLRPVCYQDFPKELLHKELNK